MKRVHLYTLPKDTALPTDTSEIPDGYPYLVSGVLHYLVKGPNGDGSDDTWETVTPAVHAPAHEIGGGDEVRRTALNRIAADASQTVSTSCSVVGCTSAGITITLASSMVADGAWIDVVDESGGAAAGPISVTTEGELIDGVSTLTIDADHGQVRLYSDGTNWFTRSVETAAQVGAVDAGDVENGNAAFSGDGAATTFTISHGLGAIPTTAFVQPTSVDARDNGPAMVTNKTSTSFDVVLPTAPPSGTDNVGFDYQAWV